MRIVGPNGFKAAAFIHDKKVISATKNIGWCSGWPVDRFTRFVEQRGWQIIRDDDGEGAGERRDQSDLLYISRPHDGLVYVAQRSRNGSQRLLWSVIPREPFGPELRADAADVPREIRRQAYRHLGKVAVET